MNMGMKITTMEAHTQLMAGRVGFQRRLLTMTISGSVTLVLQMGEKIKRQGW